VAPAAEAAWSGWMWATKVVTPRPRSQSMAAVAASVASPSPWRLVAMTQASSASVSDSVACVVPTGVPAARSRATQFSQPAVPSGEWPATWRA